MESLTKFFSSLRVRLTIYSGILTFALLFSTWALVTLGSQSYSETHSKDILNTVSKSLLKAMRENETAESNFPKMIEEINEAAFQTSQRLVVVHLKNGKEVARSHTGPPQWPLEHERTWKTMVLPYHGDELLAALYFGETQERLNLQAWAFAGVCFEVFVLVNVGSWLLVGAVLSPIGELSRQAHNAGMELDTRLEPPSTDLEISELVTTFNQFLDRLTESAAVRARFYASASHELRTPLQALVGHLELALSREREAHDYKSALLEARSQTERLISLTQALLTLNRLEVDAVSQYQKIDLVDYCENEWLQFQAKIRDRNLKATCELPEEITFCTLPTYLTILIRNLLENAVKYSPKGGVLRFLLHPANDDEVATLVIFNTNGSVTEEDLTRLKEPFFRPDKIRESTTSGNGLGLAICHAIANRQGWELDLTLLDDGFQAKVIFKTKTHPVTL